LGAATPRAAACWSASYDIIERMLDNVSLPDERYPQGYADKVHAASLDEQAALVALLRARRGRESWLELTALVREAGSAGSAYDKLESTGLFPSEAQQTRLIDAKNDVMKWRAADVDFVTILEERYPSAVRDIHQAPPFLFARGTLRKDDVGVSVVGTRHASPRGLDIATDVSLGLVDLGITVVSGLALGIDSAAHRAALDSGGRTVSIIATGIDRCYPPANRGLLEEIAHTGLVLSQFWPDAPPQKHNFLMRNATMSGYGIATVVVEAGEHSGARAQARMAVEHGRPVILFSLIVDQTQWGKVLVGRPGVSVASTISEAIGIVRELRQADDAIARALRELLEA
jgi:DNA processing protein